MKRRKFLKGLGGAALLGAAASSGKGSGLLGGLSLTDLPGCSVQDVDFDPTHRIKHLIVLMMENRSFDHMLGFSGIPGIDGVTQACSNPYKGRTIHATPDARFSGDLMVDPGHDYDDVKVQLYFPDPTGLEPPAGLEPKMQGFVESYAKDDAAEPPNVMKCFSPESVPILTTLARNFVVCNRWFASIPGPTLPNRLFAHAGTSQGHLDMSVIEVYTKKTIYEVLGDANVSSTIYADGWSATTIFPHLMKYPDQFFGTLDDFYQDCYDDNLPSYCFLEPRYSSSMVNGVFRPQNDQHPNSDVAEGEQLIRDVYYAIRSNPKVWKSSMLVVTYDEHGGIYDHVPPPKAIPPGDGSRGDFGFKFDRYGVRVPAVIVSAYTEHQVIDDVFDHTSLIATARKLFTRNYRDAALYNRAMCANTFDKALNRTAEKGPLHEPAELPVVEHRPQDRGSLTADLNHLQIMNLKQAILVNASLPASLRINPKSILKKEVTNSSADVEFKGIKAKDADHFNRQVHALARNSGALVRGEQLQKGATK